ncbi:hypothetical protein SESBI_26397, partial [Sesbania bispinosa]
MEVFKKGHSVKKEENWMKVMDVWVAPFLGRKISHKDAARGWKTLDKPKDGSAKKLGDSLSQTQILSKC